MAQTIKLKRSAQSGASGIPGTSDLALGEVGINTYHGKMYIKKNDGSDSIVEISADKLPLTGGTLTGALTANSGIIVDNVTLDANKIATSSGNFTIDSASDIILDADGGNVMLKDDSVWFGNFNHNGNNLAIDAKIQDGDIVFRGNDGGSTITALTLDMSAAGEATFNSDILLFDSKSIRFGTDQDFRISNDGSHTTLQNSIADQDILIKGNDGGSTITALTLDMSNAGKATFNGIVSSAQGFERGNLFITENEIDLSSGSFTLDVAGNITLNADGSVIMLSDDTINFGQFYQNASGALNIYAPTQDKDIVFLGNDGGSTITAATFDMSNEGHLTLNDGITINASSFVNAGTLMFTGTGNAAFVDNRQLFFGSSLDMTIKHNSSTGNNEILTNSDFLLDSAGDIILDADGGDIQLKDGGSIFGLLSNDNFTLKIQNHAQDTDIKFIGNDGGSLIDALTLDMSAAGAATFNSHVKLFDSNQVQFGNSNDGSIHHDGNHFRLKSTTGNFNIQTDDFHVTDSSNTTLRFRVDADGATDIRYNGSTKLVTTSSGIQTTGTVNVNSAYSFPTSDGSSGQALVTDGSGNVTFGSVSAGAATSLQDADGDTKIQVEESSDEDIIRFDAGGKEVAKMEYRSNEVFLDLKRRDVNAYANLSFSGLGLNTNTPAGYNPLVLQVGGAEKFRVNSSGNVGIGTSTPQHELVVASTGNTTLGLVGSGYDDAIAIRFGGGDLSNALGNGNSGAAIISQQYVVGGAAKGDLRFQVNTGDQLDTAMFISNAGKVGVGTASPGSFVESSRFVVGTGTSGTNEMMFLYSGTNTFGALGFADGTSGTEAYRGIMGYDHNTDTMFFSTAGGGNASRDMIITSNGGVTIGTTTTTGSGGLLVSNDIKTDSRFGVGSAGNTSTPALYHVSDADTGVYFPAANTLGFVTGGSERMRINSSGQVGIGTTSPAQTLHVGSGHILVERGVEFRSKDTGGSERTLVRINGSNDLEYGYSGSGAVKFMGGGSYTERMRIHTDGNIGIGESSPTSPLHVTHTGGTGVRLKTDGDTDSNLIHFKTSANTGQGYIGTEGGTAGTNFSGSLAYAFMVGGTASGSRLQFLSAGVVRGTFDTSGNLGIGTTSPAQKLDVNGNIAVGGTIVIDSNKRFLAADGAANVPYITFAADTNTGLYRPGADILGFSSGGSERMRVHSDGKLLVAKTSPDATNTVGHELKPTGVAVHTANGATPLYLNRKSNDGGIAEFRKDNTAVGSIGSADSDNLFISGSAANHAGLKFGTLAFIPIVAGSNSDNTVNLGMTSYRFHDAHFGGTVNVGENLVVTGDLTINGTTTTLNTATLDVEDKNITLNYGTGDTTSTANGAGITIQDAVDASTNATLTWDTSNDSFNLSHLLNVPRIIQTSSTGSNFYAITLTRSGSGTSNPDLMGSNGTFVLGTSSSDPRLALTTSGAAVTGNLSATGSISASGNISSGFFEIGDDTATTTATTQVSIASFSASSVRSCKLLVQITNTTDSTYHFTEIAIIHDGTDTYMTEVGTMFTGTAAEATFTSDISSGSVRLLATPASTDSMTFKVVRQMINA